MEHLSQQAECAGQQSLASPFDLLQPMQLWHQQQPKTCTEPITFSYMLLFPAAWEKKEGTGQAVVF